QEIAVTAQRQDAAPGLRDGEAEGDGDGAAHRPPEREVERRVAGVGDVPGGRAEPADDQHPAALGEDRLDDVAPAQREVFALLGHCSDFPNVLLPMTRCAISTATEMPPSKARRAACSTVSPMRDASSTG